MKRKAIVLLILLLGGCAQSSVISQKSHEILFKNRWKVTGGIQPGNKDLYFPVEFSIIEFAPAGMVYSNAGTLHFTFTLGGSWHFANDGTAFVMDFDRFQKKRRLIDKLGNITEIDITSPGQSQKEHWEFDEVTYDNGKLLFKGDFTFELSPFEPSDSFDIISLTQKSQHIMDSVRAARNSQE